VRLGGPVTPRGLGPEEWAARARALGYRAVNAPLDESADDATVRAYVRAAEAADLVIAEVGAWSNPISPDPDVARAARELNERRLDLADRLGARCCVNIAGSRGARWDGPHPDNLSAAVFDLVVETVRGIIDAVRPTRTHYCLETMPWVFPDSADSYLALIRAIDRPQFAVHLDPVNLVASPRLYYDTGALLRECFATLGPYIVSCHAKDIALADTLTVHLSEVRPGLGALDYRTFLREMARLDPDTPLMLEHLPGEDEYALAAAHIRAVAAEVGVPLA
jgi:sugar phosphate isomerase/epimerase